jgi:hypothetical protein
MQRRSILIKGLVAAVVAFLICMGAVWGVEKVIGNSLSCGFWGTCPVGAAPGFHFAGYDGTGAGSSITVRRRRNRRRSRRWPVPVGQLRTAGRTVRSSRGPGRAWGNRTVRQSASGPEPLGSTPTLLLTPAPLPTPTLLLTPAPLPDSNALRLVTKSLTRRARRRPLSRKGSLRAPRPPRTSRVPATARPPVKRGPALAYRMPARASAGGSLVGPGGEIHGDNADQIRRAIHP